MTTFALRRFLRPIWLGIFLTWLCGQFVIVLYLELFSGWQGVFTQMFIRRSLRRSESTFEHAREHWIDHHQSATSVLPPRIRDVNVTSFKNIVGIGCIKCGSTFFHALLRQNMRLWEKHHEQCQFHFVFKFEESHYFDRCAAAAQNDCSFERYLQVLSEGDKHDPLQYRPFGRTWIFGEKTVSYLSDYNSAHLLSLYAHRYEMFMYVVLRNPIKQLWSHLWMRTEGCRPTRGVKLQCLFIRNELYWLRAEQRQDIDVMAQYLQHFLSDRVASELPIFDEIMRALQIGDENTGNNDDIDVERMVQLLQQQSSDILHYYSTVFVNSCHFCLLLMWYHEWNRMHVHPLNMNEIPFEDRFRIIQIEPLWSKDSQQQRVAQLETVQRLMCWTIGLEMDIDECMQRGMIGNATRDNSGKVYRKYAPDLVDVFDLNVSNTIRDFYRHSVQRLQWFIERHPQIMLGGAEFTP